MLDTQNSGHPEEELSEREGTPAGAESLVSKEDRAWFEELLQKETLTPEERTQLAEKYKGYDKALSRKLSQVDEVRRRVQEREVEIAEVANSLKQAKSQPPSLSVLKQEGKSILDSWMEQTSDPASRETIRTLGEAIRDTIHKETNIGELRKTVDELRQLLQEKNRIEQTTRQDFLERDLDDLERRYGSPLVEKYREKILQTGLKFPQYSAREILHSVAKPDEVEQALEVAIRRRSTNGSGTEPKKPATVVSTTSQSVPEKYRAAKGDKPQDIQNKSRQALREALAKVPGLGKVL